jgi:DeoR family transcriptional regulator, aga operon transcriptional repressor
MRRADRLNAIMERLTREGTVAVSALSEGLGVSEASVRRDLSLLEAQQWLSRTHGGAVARGGPAEASRRAAAGERQAFAARIAQLACERADGATRIALTGGPLAVPIGRVLAQREGITVVTNALQVAYELSLRSGITVVVPGGAANGTGSIVAGPLTDMSLREMRFDVALVTGDGISADAGLTADNEAVAYAARSFIASAGQAIAVLDAPAVGRTTFTRICGLERLDELVTAEDVDPGTARGLAAAGLRVTDR